MAPGHNAEGRERGWSGLGGNVDTRISCRKPEKLRASIVFEKVKDGEDGIQLDLRLEPVRFGLDEDGDPVTTLAVMSAEQINAEPKAAKMGRPPAQQRLLMDMVEQAMIGSGQFAHPFSDGPKVKVVTEEAIRLRYVERIAEKPGPNETPEEVAERLRRAFKRTLTSAINAKRLVAAAQDGQRIIWLPTTS